MRSTRAILRSILGGLLTAVTLGVLLAGTRPVLAESPAELEQRVVGIVAEMRRLCRGDVDFAAAGPRIKALARDRQARDFMSRYYGKDYDPLIPIELLLVAVEYDWQRDAFDEALATAQAWQSDGSSLSLGMFFLLRILEHRAIAARGVEPPSPGWTTAWRIEQVRLEGLDGALAVAWKRAECPANGPPSRKMLVALYVSQAGSEKLRMLGAAAEADLPNIFEYENQFFATAAFPDRRGVRHSYLIAKYGVGPGWSILPESIELLALDEGGLRRVEVEHGDVLDHLEALSGDGRYQAISYDRRLTQACVAPPLGKIGPKEHGGMLSCVGSLHEVPIVLDWHDGGLMEACRDFPGYYEEVMRAIRERPPLSPQLMREKETVFQRRMWDAFALFAAIMQQGKLNEALARFDSATDGSVFTGNELIRARNAAGYLRTQVEHQRAALDRPCPMSGFALE